MNCGIIVPKKLPNENNKTIIIKTTLGLFSDKRTDNGENYDSTCTHQSYRHATKKAAEIDNSFRHFQKYDKHRHL